MFIMHPHGVNHYINRTPQKHNFPGISNQKTKNVYRRHLDTLFQGYSCPGINSCTEPAAVDITNAEI